jgi:hypothetical protein
MAELCRVKSPSGGGLPPASIVYQEDVSSVIEFLRVVHFPSQDTHSIAYLAKRPSKQR